MKSRKLMAKSKLQAALEKNGGGVNRYITESETYESDEELMQAALENKTEESEDGASQLARANKRASLLKKAGFDYFDVRDLQPNENNTYTIDDGSIESLASLIYETKNTTPLIVRATPSGYEIIDGERRYRAHLLLGKRYGEHWYMVPARCFEIGKLSDEEANFILHAENIGQRNMTPSERAAGMAAVQERILKARKNDSAFKGRATKEILAEQFGVSPRTATMEVTIGKSLCAEGKELYDNDRITKTAAHAIALLDEESQKLICTQIRNGSIEKKNVEKTAQERRRGSARKEKEANEYLRSAKKNLQAALKAKESPDKKLIAEVHSLLQEIEEL